MLNEVWGLGFGPLLRIDDSGPTLGSMSTVLGSVMEVCMRLQVTLAKQILERNQRGLPIHKVPSG